MVGALKFARKLCKSTSSKSGGNVECNSTPHGYKIYKCTEAQTPSGEYIFVNVQDANDTKILSREIFKVKRDAIPSCKSSNTTTRRSIFCLI
jgi:hypothetical protein